MKSEIRITASEVATSAFRAAMGDKVIPVRTSKKNGFAFDTGVKDENGKPVYVVFEATVKATEDNKTGSVKAFDLEAAVQELLDYENTPKKEAKTKTPDPEAEAKRAKANAMKEMVAVWCLENLPAEGMTTSEIKAAIPELADITVMQVGSWLTAIAKENPAIQRDVVKGKPTYTLA